MRTAAIALVVLFLEVGGAGCGGSAPAPSSPQATPRHASADEAPPPGRRWRGWRYQGKRQDCFFRVGRRCFDKLELACSAAGCATGQCQHDDRAPARVSCRAD